MIDIKPFIKEKLETIAPVELSFGGTERELPVICITETENSARVVLDGRDVVDRITLQLDLYAESVYDTEELAARVNGALTDAGLRRSFSQLLTDGDIPRRCMRFTCGIDENSGRILKL